MRTAAPGNILFYKSNGHSFFVSRLISAFSHGAGEDSKYGHYCHVAQVGGQNDLYEMTWPRARRTELNVQELEKHYTIECWRVAGGAASRWGWVNAEAWCHHNLGMKYDWKLLLMGLGDDTHREVCSTFIYRAWNEGAGIDLYPNAPKEKIVSPSELVTSPLLERLW